jgi:hypothetical protein
MKHHFIWIPILLITVLASAFNQKISNENRLTFVEKTLNGISDVYSETFGAAFSDINNDGLDDLIVSNHGWRIPGIFLNDGQGGFKDFSSLVPYQMMIIDRHGITVADIDNDGDKDLLIAAGGAEGVGRGGPNNIFLNRLMETGSLSFEDVTPQTGLSLESQRSRSFIPLASRDGKRVDFYLTAQMRAGWPNLYLKNQSLPGRIALISDSSPNLNQEWFDEGRDVFFDWDRDGDQDLVALVDGRALLFVNDQHRFSHVQSGLETVPDVVSLAVGDLNNDGYLDIILGTQPPDSYSDNLSWNKNEVHIRFQDSNPNPGYNVKDMDGVDVATGAREVAIDFLSKPGILPDDPSDIFLGRNRIHPSSRTVRVTASEAEGMPVIDQDGIYIWIDSQPSPWHVRCQFGTSLSSAQGILKFSQIQNATPYLLETFAGSLTRDRIFMNNKGQAFEEFEKPALIHDEQTRAIAIYDFNNDGWQDVIGIRGTEPGEYNGRPFILVNGPDNVLKLQDNNPFDNPEDDIFQADQLVVGFVDNNGLPDVFMTNGYGLIPGNRGPYKLFLNNTQTENGYVLLELTGDDSNKDAIGAQVELRTSDDKLLGYRELGAGYNRMQSTHKVHFGLGNYSGELICQIRWPDGNTTRTSAAANRLVRIREKSALRAAGRN